MAARRRARRSGLRTGALLAAALTMAGVSPAAAQDAGAGSRQLNAALNRLAVNPADAEALVAAGDAALAMGDHEAAAEFLTRADRLWPNNPRIKAALAAATVRGQNPIAALRLFDEAERAGVSIAPLAGDRGLAYDLVGATEEAQRWYRRALAAAPSDEVVRRLALSLAISGDRKQFEAVLLPQLQRRVDAAWRARAFGLAILGAEHEAVTLATTMMPAGLAQSMIPYLRTMPRLTPAQQAAAAHFGVFPRAADIGRDDPRVVAYAARRPRPADAALVPQGRPLGAAPGQTARDARQRTAAQGAAAVRSTRRPAADSGGGRYTADLQRRQRPPTGASSSSLRPQAPAAPATTTARAVVPAPAVPTAQAATAVPQGVGPPPPRPAAVVPPVPPAATSPQASVWPRLAGSAPVGSPWPPATVSGPAPPLVPSAPPPMPPPLPAAVPALAPPPMVDPRPAVALAAPVPTSAAPAMLPPAASVPPSVPVPAPVLPPPPAAPPGASAAPWAAAPGPPPYGPPAPYLAAVPPAPAAGAAPLPSAPPPVMVPSGPAVAAPVSAAPAAAAPGGQALAEAFSGFSPPPEESPAVGATAPMPAPPPPAAAPPASAPGLAAGRPGLPPAAAAAAAHPSRVWVQVGTGRDRRALAFDWRRLMRQAPDALGGRKPWLAPAGQSSRLLVGPFPGGGAAQAFLNRLQANGVAAVLWTSPAGQPIEPLPPS